MPRTRNGGPIRARGCLRRRAALRTLLAHLCELAALRRATKNARLDLRPGFCTGKAHKREHLGYGGRRVLVSRKWSGKSLADHKHERRAWVVATLGQMATDDSDRYLWEPAAPDDPDVPPLAHWLLRAVAERTRWRQALDDGKAQAVGQTARAISATEGVAA